MRRFFINTPIASEMEIIGDDVRHIGRVLRMKKGDKCIVVASDGQSAKAVINEVGKDTVRLGLEAILHEDKEPPIKVVLVQGLPKSDKMDYIVQKAVELGVDQIIPMAAERSVVHYNNQKQITRVERWQKVAAEAAKQCGRSTIPTVSGIQSFSEILDNFPTDAEIIMLYEGQAKSRLSDVLKNAKTDIFVLLIGPEGGFSADEVNRATESGARIATMGPRILRTETAAVAALTAVLYECGDLGG